MSVAPASSSPLRTGRVIREYQVRRETGRRSVSSGPSRVVSTVEYFVPWEPHQAPINPNPGRVPGYCMPSSSQVAVPRPPQSKPTTPSASAREGSAGPSERPRAFSSRLSPSSHLVRSLEDARVYLGSPNTAAALTEAASRAASATPLPGSARYPAGPAGAPASPRPLYSAHVGAPLSSQQPVSITILPKPAPLLSSAVEPVAYPQPVQPLLQQAAPFQPAQPQAQPLPPPPPPPMTSVRYSESPPSVTPVPSASLFCIPPSESPPLSAFPQPVSVPPAWAPRTGEPKNPEAPATRPRYMRHTDSSSRRFAMEAPESPPAPPRTQRLQRSRSAGPAQRGAATRAPEADSSARQTPPPPAPQSIPQPQLVRTLQQTTQPQRLQSVSVTQEQQVVVSTAPDDPALKTLRQGQGWVVLTPQPERRLPRPLRELPVVRGDVVDAPPPSPAVTEAYAESRLRDPIVQEMLRKGMVTREVMWQVLVRLGLVAKADEWITLLKEVFDHPRAPLDPTLDESPSPPSSVTRLPRLGRNRRALLISCCYPDSAAAPLSPTKAQATLLDLHGTQRMLLRHGYTAPEIKTLCDAQGCGYPTPTFEAIVSGLRWLAQGAAAGDGLLLVFSGSATPSGITSVFPSSGTAGSRPPPHRRVTFCPADWKTAGLLTDDVFYELLIRPLPRGCRLLALMDCHGESGSLDLPFVCRPGRDILSCANPLDKIKADVLAFSSTDVRPVSGSSTVAQVPDFGRSPLVAAFLQTLGPRTPTEGPLTLLRALNGMQTHLVVRLDSRAGAVEMSASKGYTLFQSLVM